MKKFELTRNAIEMHGKTLFQIRAVSDFGCVKCGELGGYVEIERNLSQEGSAWVFRNARVYGNARVSENARVYGDAIISRDARLFSERDYVTVKGFGRENRYTTFFREKTGTIGVECGCFSGTIKEFKNQVKNTHGESRLGKEYLMLADLIEYRLKNDKK